MENTQELQITVSSPDGNSVNGRGVEEASVLMPGPEPQTPARTKSRYWTKRALICGPRRFAILSIVCGLSCIGIKALFLALKAEKEQDKTFSRRLSHRSYKWATLSIVGLWFGVLLLLPLLLVLVSYVLAQIE